MPAVIPAISGARFISLQLPARVPLTGAVPDASQCADADADGDATRQKLGIQDEIP